MKNFRLILGSHMSYGKSLSYGEARRKFLFQSGQIHQLIFGSKIHTGIRDCSHTGVCDWGTVCLIGLAWREEEHFFHPPSAMMLKNSSLLIDISVHRCHSLPDIPESFSFIPSFGCYCKVKASYCSNKPSFCSKDFPYLYFKARSSKIPSFWSKRQNEGFLLQ